MDIQLLSDISPKSALGAAVQNLIRSQLQTDEDLESTLRSIGFRSGNTKIVAGFVDNELATMNAFMPQEFVRRSASIVGYQSGFSATNGAHRGKGLWPKLMAKSLECLESEGAGFVFGFPNPVSHPLFEKKLGFQTIFMSRTVLPAFASRLVKNSNPPSDDHFVPDLRSLADMKKNGDSTILVYEAPGCFGFGKSRAKGGLNILDIGGISADDGDLGRPIRGLCRLGRALAFRLEASALPIALGMVKGVKTRPAIFKALRSDLEISDFEFCAGLADSF